MNESEPDTSLEEAIVPPVLVDLDAPVSRQGSKPTTPFTQAQLKDPQESNNMEEIAQDSLDSKQTEKKKKAEEEYETFLRNQQLAKEKKPAVAVKDLSISPESIENSRKYRKPKFGKSLTPKKEDDKGEGKYFEIPHVLDGFLMLNRAPAEDPDDVLVLDVSGKELNKVIEDDLELFSNLHTLRAGDNNLEMESLGNIPHIKTLSLPLNGISRLTFATALKFPLLEASGPIRVTEDHSLMVLAALPNLMHLDLTANKIDEMPEGIVDMRDWWKENIGDIQGSDHHQRESTKGSKKERVFSSGTSSHSRSLSLALSEVMKLDRKENPDGTETIIETGRAMTGMSSTTNNFQKIMNCEFPLPGFLHLQYLGLEDNYMCDKEDFDILAKLPSLKVLNLNNNRIKSLSFLLQKSPSQPADADAHMLEWSINGEDKAKSKSQHSIDSTNEKMNERRSSSARVTIPTDSSNKGDNSLIGIRRYRGFYKLEELRIARNHIKDVDGLLGITALPHLTRVFLEGNPVMDRVRTPEKSDTPILTMLPDTFGIQICDPIYQNVRLNTMDYTLLSPKALKAGVYQSAHGKSGRSYSFISKKPIGALVHQRRDKKNAFGLPHDVEPFTEARGTLRRQYKYSEEDIKRMIHMGRIYTLKELSELMGSDDSFSETGSTTVKEQEPTDDFLSGRAITDIGDENVLKENHTYDPAAKDDTFITGVHIVDAEKEDEWLDEWNEEDSDEESLRLPLNVHQSIQALRHAMHHPVSYERVQEASYTQTTFAHRKRLKHVEPRFHLPKNFRNQGSNNPTDFHQDRSKNKLPPLWRQPGQPHRPIYNDHYAQSSSRHYDDFQEMTHMMKHVDEKLSMIEANLSTVLGDKRLRQRLPLTKDLLKEVRRVYDRIQKEYTQEAYSKLKKEQTSLQIATTTQ